MDEEAPALYNARNPTTGFLTKSHQHVETAWLTIIVSTVFR